MQRFLFNRLVQKNLLLHSLCPKQHLSQSEQALFKADWNTLVHMLRASTDMSWDFYCHQLHSYILRSGFGSDVSISNALIRFYVKLGSLNGAHKVFVEMPHPSVVSWNSIISGFVGSAQFSKALGSFLELDRSDIFVDLFSLTAALAACGPLSLLRLGRSVHSKIVKSGVENGIVVSNCLIDMYGKCGSVEEAMVVFSNMIDKDIISWNSAIAACAKNGDLKQAVCFVQQMPKPDTISYNELINGYAQFGEMEEAVEILSRMPNPDSSSWNSIITGFVNRNQAREALAVLCKMHLENLRTDEFTFSSILSGIAGLSALTWGMLIHCCSVKRGFDTCTVVGSALIDMYSKCGEVTKAELIFKSLADKNLITWNAMVSGFAHNGNSSRVLELFDQLQLERTVQPDEITFLNVLSACAHNRMPFETAFHYFKIMIEDYGIEPSIEHCCCMIRLMGQRGELRRRAVELIYELGFGGSALAWRALLGTCEGCTDLKLAKIAAAKVIELEGDKGYAYIVISNMYASYGKWEDVKAVRKLTREEGVRKIASYSWIEVVPYSPS
ncbi:putative pentatricopeptide repeat-containing protein At5g47460 [Cannabis sativa]|nr:putative pentatricopeptide repeat-containing protein At5g47460 [Cannabis sativa]